MSKTLLVWELRPEETRLYVFDDNSEMAELAIQSAGLFINSDDVKEGDPIDLLQDKLTEHTPLPSWSLAEGPFSRVVVCGFVM